MLRSMPADRISFVQRPKVSLEATLIGGFLVRKKPVNGPQRVQVHSSPSGTIVALTLEPIRHDHGTFQKPHSHGPDISYI
ncbi:hypothetical protein E2C01_059559 [Portunus trituberculatus]|uniref:Uncharacterized protein n=1 Tax=Portunus trituberculatus TaxID=210409 RepID=A0A5B7H670_PORTR|nr:hypothetical protein [Portunus trituberculatus]